MVALLLALITSACASSRPDGTAGPLGAESAAGAGTVPMRSSSATADPRCLAARQVLVRPAVLDDDVAGPTPKEQVDLLTRARPLAEGEDLADLDWVLDVTRRYVERPTLLANATVRELHTRLDRLTVWAATTCPKLERIWGCSARTLYPPVADSVGFIEEDEPISSLDALQEWYGDAIGEPEELDRTENRVVYAWLDLRGLVARRALVERTGAFWAVQTISSCSSNPDDPVWPEDASVSVDAEGPDLDDYLALLPMIPVPPLDAPAPACRYDPYNLTDSFGTLGQYVASGQAQAGCLYWMGPAGWACVGSPATADRTACFDLDPVFPPPSTTTTSSTLPGDSTSATTTPGRPGTTPTTRPRGSPPTGQVIVNARGGG